MSRMYIVNHWSDAAAYSGEQIGQRLADSKALHFNRDGSANTQLYTDSETKPKEKSKPSLRDRISLADRHFNRIEAMSLELEKEYRQGNISNEEYSYLKPKMQKRLDDAWKRLCKENKWEEELEHSTKQALLLEKQEENKRSSQRNAKVQGYSEKLLKVVKSIGTNSFTQFFGLSTIVLVAAKMIF